MDTVISVFTLNSWGIPYVSKDRRERIKAISEYLLTSKYNIVCLQEIWSEKDFFFLKKQLLDLLPYSHYFYSGVLGSGLCVFSKWPIEDVFFHQWQLNGYIHKLQHGDWFGGKGVGLCRINCNGLLVNVYCAHLHAEYPNHIIGYMAHRLLQAYTMAEFIHLTMKPADVVILAGDLNADPGDLLFRIITKHTNLTDPFNLDCENSNLLVLKPSGTSDNIENSYANRKLAKALPEGKRIDHILFYVATNLESNVLSFGNPLPHRVPGKSFSYSDHFAVGLDLHIRSLQPSIPHLEGHGTNLGDDIGEAINICENAKSSLNVYKKVYLIIGTLMLVLLLGTIIMWHKNLVQDLLTVLITIVCFYCFLMGTLWHRIEMNGLKSCLLSFQNLKRLHITQKGPIQMCQNFSESPLPVRRTPPKKLST